MKAAVHAKYGPPDVVRISDVEKCSDTTTVHPEYMAIPEDGLLAAMPANLTFAEAAPSTEGSHYALSFIRTATIHSGQRVLVNGATGAIGSAAVQLLKSLVPT